MTGVNKFANSFWESDIYNSVGFDTVNKRMKDGRKMCKDLEDYLNTRYKIENHYAKEMFKLVKSMEVREEVGGLEKSWNSLRIQTENIAYSHEVAAATFHSLVNDLERMHETLKLQAKQHEDRVTRSYSTVKSLLSKCTSLHRTYDQKCGEWETTNNELKYMERYSSTTDQKLLIKTRAKDTKTREEMEKSDTNYKNSVETTKKAKAQWESDMEEALETYQQLDQKRIETMREVMWKTTNVHSKVCEQDDESCERIRKVLEHCDVEQDISNFIKNNWTGYSRPETIEYKNYFGSTDTPSAKKNNTKQPCQTRMLPSLPNPSTSFYYDVE